MDSRLRYRSTTGHTIPNSFIVGQTHCNTNNTASGLSYVNNTKFINNNSGTSTGRTLSNRPLYTMCGAPPLSPQQPQAFGAQLLMNAPNVASATHFQFIPARTYTSSSHHNRYGSMTNATTPDDFTASASFGAITSSVMPFLSSIKGFFTNLMKPRFGPDYSGCYPMDSHPTAQREYNSAPNIYMNIMTSSCDLNSNNKCDLAAKDKLSSSATAINSPLIDVDCYFDATTLSASTKSFSDCDLRTSKMDDDGFSSMASIEDTYSIVSPSVSEKAFCSDQSESEVTKEPITEVEPKSEIPSDMIDQSPLSSKRQRRNRCRKTIQPAEGNLSKTSELPLHKAATMSLQHKKLKNSFEKNRKEKNRSELTRKIHEDIESQSDESEWDADTDGIAIETQPQSKDIQSIDNQNHKKAAAAFTCFTTADFPAMPGQINPLVKSTCESPTIKSPPPPLKRNLSWEIPIPQKTCLLTKFANHWLKRQKSSVPPKCIKPFKEWLRVRQTSECDSEDSFIVFTGGDSGGSTATSPSTRSHMNSSTSAPQLSSSVESTQSSICDRIRSRFGRTRSISESSDDFIYFADDDEHGLGDVTVISDFDSGEEDDDDDRDDCDEASDSDIDNETVEDFMDASDDEELDMTEDVTDNVQNLDSGFEDRQNHKKFRHLRVHFDVLPPVIHVMHAWNFAYRQARKSTWEQVGRDRVRFHDRVSHLAATLDPILANDHRQRIFTERFISDDQ